MSGVADHNQALQHLAQQLRRLEKTSREARCKGGLFSTGIPALDRLLPEQGISPGTLVEWLSRGDGCGAGTLVFAVAAHLTQGNGACVIIDRNRSFYPPPLLLPSHQKLSASDLDRTIVVHPPDKRDTLWALEQSLRCCGVAVVICRLGHLNDHAYRRLQLAAETGGGIGLLLRPGEHRSQPSWADIRLWVEALPFDARFERKPSSETDALTLGRLLRIELIHCRGRAGGEAVELEIDDETGDVRLAPRLAVAKDSIRAAGA